MLWTPKILPRQKKTDKQLISEMETLPCNLHPLLCQENWKDNCPWSISNPNFGKRTNYYPSWQMRQCEPVLKNEYGRTMAGLLCSRYLPNGEEDEEFRLLHVYRKGEVEGRKKIKMIKPNEVLSSHVELRFQAQSHGRRTKRKRSSIETQPQKYPKYTEKDDRIQQNLMAETLKKAVRVSVICNAEKNNQDSSVHYEPGHHHEKTVTCNNSTDGKRFEVKAPKKNIKSSQDSCSLSRCISHRKSKRHRRPNVRYGDEFIKINGNKHRKGVEPDLSSSLNPSHSQEIGNILEDDINLSNIEETQCEKQNQCVRLLVTEPTTQEQTQETLNEPFSGRIESIANHLGVDLPQKCLSEQVSHFELLLFGKNVEASDMEGRSARLISRIRFLENELGLLTVRDRITACAAELGNDLMNIETELWTLRNQVASLETKVYGSITTTLEDDRLVDRIRRIEIDLGLGLQ